MKITANLGKLAASATTVTGTALDITAFCGPLQIVQDVHTITGTPTLNGKIQDSADGSTGWADVTGATFTQVTTTAAHESIIVDSRSCKQYIRYVGTIAGTTPAYTGSVILVGEKVIQ